MNDTKPPAHWKPDWWNDPETLIGQHLRHDIYEYRLDKFLKKGGFSCTYLARQWLAGALLPREVVVKLLYILDSRQAEEKLRRAVVEAYVLELIRDDPHFVGRAANSYTPACKPEQINAKKAHELYLNQRGRPSYFHVLTYMSGGTLREKVAKKGRLPEEEAIKIAVEAGQGLHRLHTVYGVLHRDSNPSNLLQNENGRWLWTDFGLAKLLNDNNALGQVTVPRVSTASSPGHPGGTGGYIPEESGNGQDTVQRDVYALTVTTLEMITGVLPSPGQDAHWYHAWRPLIESRLDQVRSPQLRAILQKGLAEKPEHRYRTVADFVRALESYLKVRKAQKSAWKQPANWGRIITEAPRRLQTIGGIFQKGWQKLSGSGQNGHLALPLASWQREFSNRLFNEPVHYLLPALFVFLILRSWFQTWPDFYGPTMNLWLPLVLGGLAFATPPWAILAALLCLAPLLFSLSPVLGLLAFLMGGFWVTRIFYLSNKQVKEAALVGGLIGLAPLFAYWNIALAIPVIIGMIFGRAWAKAATAALNGFLVGGLTFLALVLWATLVGAESLEPVFLFDPYRHAPYRYWVIDFTARELFDSQQFGALWRQTWQDDPGAIVNLLKVVWLASVAPLWGFLSWSGVGVIAAILGRRRRDPLRSVWNGLPASAWAIMIFIGLYWLLLQTPGMPDWGARPILSIGFWSLLAANAPTAVEYFWRN